MTETTAIEYIKEKIGSIEVQLSQVAQALITLARLEERQVNHTRELNGLKKDIDGFYNRINIVEHAVASNKSKVGFGEKFWWIIITALVTATVTALVLANGS